MDDVIDMHRSAGNAMDEVSRASEKLPTGSPLLICLGAGYCSSFLPLIAMPAAFSAPDPCAFLRH